jgi:hypothetical protein
VLPSEIPPEQAANWGGAIYAWASALAVGLISVFIEWVRRKVLGDGRADQKDHHHKRHEDADDEGDDAE